MHRLKMCKRLKKTSAVFILFRCGHAQAVRHCAEVDSAAAVSAVAAVAAALTEAPTTATAAVKGVDRLLHRFVAVFL